MYRKANLFENHESWGIMFSTKILVNVFFNNKQKLSKGFLSNDNFKKFKKRQRKNLNQNCKYKLSKLYSICLYTLSKFTF